MFQENDMDSCALNLSQDKISTKEFTKTRRKPLLKRKRIEKIESGHLLGKDRPNSQKIEPEDQVKPAEDESSSTNLFEPDLHCSICVNMFTEPHVTRCGHTFCRNCLMRAINIQPVCPKCETTLGQKDHFPNHAVNDMIRVRQRNKKHLEHMTIDQIVNIPGHIPLDSITSIIEALQERREVLEDRQQRIHNQMLHHFLNKMKTQKQNELDSLQRELKTIDGDLEIAERNVRLAADSENALVPDADRPDVLSSLLDSSSGRRRRLDHHFTDLTKSYIENRCAITEKFTLDDFSNTLSKFTAYDKLNPLATLQYSNENIAQSSIVSSIDFDCDADFFAVAGVTKKIKIYDYNNVISNSVSHFHLPVHEMTCHNKISCVVWNKYHKNKLASSDYDGLISIWDTVTGKQTEKFKEHEKRCWSVDFNTVDPKILASGSDDAKVRIWALGMQKAITTIEAKANVCCVQFNPHTSMHVAFGSADHCVHYYDIRRTDQPLNVYKGHKKAVSYVKFCDANTIVSASTDSQLKLWKCDESSPQFTLSGHQNERNFVGLATDGDYIACGSEDNSLYVYYKGLQSPLMRYEFNLKRSLLNDSQCARDDSQFLSAVAWRPRSTTLLAANSQGIIKVLALA